MSKDKALSYFDFAENDYKHVATSIANGLVANALCYISHDICEKYIKHVIDVTAYEPSVLNKAKRVTSILTLHKYLKDNGFSKFNCDWNVVLKIQGFSEDAKYPGENSFIADEEDVNTCWVAVQEVRRATIDYLQSEGILPPPQDHIDMVKRLKEMAEFSEKNRGLVY